MRRETIEEFDGAGNLVKRTVTEWDDAEFLGDCSDEPVYVAGRRQMNLFEPFKVTSYHENM